MSPMSSMEHKKRHFKDCFPFNYKAHIAFKLKKLCKNTIKGVRDFVVD